MGFFRCVKNCESCETKRRAQRLTIKRERLTIKHGGLKQTLPVAAAEKELTAEPRKGHRGKADGRKCRPKGVPGNRKCRRANRGFPEAVRGFYFSSIPSSVKRMSEE